MSNQRRCCNLCENFSYLRSICYWHDTRRCQHLPAKIFVILFLSSYKFSVSTLNGNLHIYFSISVTLDLLEWQDQFPSWTLAFLSLCTIHLSKTKNNNYKICFYNNNNNYLFPEFSIELVIFL